MDISDQKPVQIDLKSKLRLIASKQLQQEIDEELELDNPESEEEAQVIISKNRKISND